MYCQEIHFDMRRVFPHPEINEIPIVSGKAMKIMTAAAGIWDRFVKWAKPDPTKLPKPISDHVARDIGMTGATLERHRHVWPSESKDRPML
jgi:hypothetical protein